MTYADLLRESARKAGNVACMGLDPQLALLPPSDKSVRERLSSFFKELFEAMRDEDLVPAAFKPNIGYWAKLDQPRNGDFSGSLALGDVLDMLDAFYPGIPVILDAKRGDIARSSGNYATEAFDCWKADAVTVAPYMGTDSVAPFTTDPEKGVYVLCRTSNPGGKDLQNLLDAEEEPFYRAVAEKIIGWKTGAVVGATNMAELKDLASFTSSAGVPFLIPGVGSQGGSASEVMAALRDAGYDVLLARINSSSGLVSPWKKGAAPENWKELCVAALKKLIEETRI